MNRALKPGSERRQGQLTQQGGESTSESKDRIEAPGLRAGSQRGVSVDECRCPPQIRMSKFCPPV